MVDRRLAVPGGRHPDRSRSLIDALHQAVADRLDQIEEPLSGVDTHQLPGCFATQVELVLQLLAVGKPVCVHHTIGGQS